MKKGNGLINVLITLIVLILIVAIIFLGYIIYTGIIGDVVINVGGNTNYPTIEYSKPINDNLVSGNDYNVEFTSNYLYDQLSDTAKIIYNELYKNKENLKTGTYVLQFGNAFSDVLSQENGTAILKNEYQSAIEAFTYENPDIFFLDVTKMYISIETITKLFSVKYNVYILNDKDPTYLSEGFYSKEDVDKCQQQIDQVRDSILAKINGKSDLEKIRYIHDYLVDTIEYDKTISKDNIYNIYGALVSKTCVCEGYAKAFQYLVSEAGIENVIVSGTATNSNNVTENHAWNYVKLNDYWYAVDTTWDDPLITGGGKITNKIRYQYFLKGSNTINKNHFPSGKFTEGGKEFELPILSVTDYNL